MIFQWDTLAEIDADDLWHQGKPVPGKKCRVELIGGSTIHVWRSEDGRQYFCHGLTFGGTAAPGGIASPYSGQPVEAIIQDFYAAIPEGSAQLGDILVWKGVAPNTTPHSAVLTDVLVASVSNRLHESGTRLQTKNGLFPETNMALERLIAFYGESYSVYRQK